MLITDCEEIITDKSDNVRSELTFISDIAKYADKEEWTWDFDLKGADYYNQRSVMKVLAFTIEKDGKRESA